MSTNSMSNKSANPSPCIVEALQILGDINPYASAALDVGCGFGVNTRAIAQRGLAVVGVDIDEATIGSARTLLSTENLRASFVRADVEQLPFSHASFDFVAATGILALVHKHRRSEIIDKVGRMVSSGGVIVLNGATRSNESSPHSQLGTTFYRAGWDVVVDRTEPLVAGRNLKALTTLIAIRP